MSEPYRTNATPSDQLPATPAVRETPLLWLGLLMLVADVTIPLMTHMTWGRREVAVQVLLNVAAIAFVRIAVLLNRKATR